MEGMQEARKTQTVAAKSLSEDVTGLQELVDQVAQGTAPSSHVCTEGGT
jgi:hypothetical protein